MKKSSRFFANTECEYYPCHKGLDELNCLFCYCPFYREEDCPGNPSWIEKSCGRIKDCSGCVFPHRAENYESVIRELKEKSRSKP